MDLPYELVLLVQSKKTFIDHCGKNLDKVPKSVLDAVLENNLLDKFSYSSDTLRFFIKGENIKILEWVIHNKNIWHQLAKQILLIAVITGKNKVVEWVLPLVEKETPWEKDDIMYCWKAVSNENWQGLELLKKWGYQYNDSLLEARQN